MRRTNRYRKARLAIRNMGAKNVSLTGRRGWSPTGFGTGWVPAPEVWDNYDATELVNYYSKSGLVFACVRELSTTIAEAALEVGYETDGEFELMEDHEALALFYENPYYTSAQILDLIVSRLSLTGASYVGLVRYKNRQGVGLLQPLPTASVKPKISGLEILGYEIAVKDNDKPIFVERDQMCWHRYLDPRTCHGVISPLATVLRDYGIDAERQNITVEMLKNQNIPGMIFELERVLTADQRKEMTDSLDAATGGEANRRGKATALPHGVKYVKPTTTTDINFDSLNALSESRICMAFGIPPIIVGAKVGLDKATYSNYAHARTSFYAETIMPLWNFIAEEFTRSVFRQQGESKLEFRFDTSKIKELQTDMNAVATRAALVYEKGVATRDEARAMIDLEPAEGEEGGFKKAAPPPTFGQPPDKKEDEESEDDEEKDEETEGKALDLADDEKKTAYRTLEVSRSGKTIRLNAV